ncbi:MAG: hypothetical protein LIP77_02115 [Planctomycetes bacterium]|nr:hypothetical protein [Planctomycetota bacterium]
MTKEEGDAAPVRTGWSRHLLAVVIAADGLVLAGGWYLVPWFKRPLEGLLIALVVLATATAVVAARRGRPRLAAAAMVALSVGLGILGLEMGEKYFSLSGLFEAPPTIAVSGGRYSWDALDPASYLAARERALRDGLNPEALARDFAGDVFAREGVPIRRVRHHTRGKVVNSLESASAESPWLRDPPLGSELRPDNLFRQYCFDEPSGEMLFDGACHTGPYGFRWTRCHEEAEEVYAFMGCSFTFGSYLNDDQTLPHYFSAGLGFDKRVINLAIGGNGPHHSLRDLELQYRLGKAGVAPAAVKAVIYSYMDQHAARVIDPNPPGSPRYVLADGRLVHTGTFASGEGTGRWQVLLDRSRFFSRVREKFVAKTGGRDEELTFAILEAMHRICRERYGVPLTVVYWDDTPAVMARLRRSGITVIPVTEAFGPRWREETILYKIFDGHPSAFANRTLAAHLVRKVAGNEPVSGE